MRNRIASVIAAVTLLSTGFLFGMPAKAQSSAIELTQQPTTSVVKQGDILPLVRKDNGIYTLYQVPLSLLQTGVTDAQAWHYSDNLADASITLGTNDASTIGTMLTTLQNTLTTLQTNTVVKTGGTSNNQTLNSPTINGGTMTNIDISTNMISPSMTAGQGAAAISANTTGLANEINRAKNAEAKLAPIDSPAFTNSPTAPTPPQGDGTTRLATTAYTDTAVAAEKARAIAAESTAAPVTSPAFKVSASIGSSTAAAPLFIDGPAGSLRSVVFRTAATGGNSYRWGILTSADSETGSNLGSNFAIARYGDNGAAIDYPLKISRSTGQLQLNATPIFPTAATGDTSTLGATTQFVASALAVEQARALAAEAKLAPINSPAFTGNPTSVTPAAGDNSTSVATTAYSDGGIATALTSAKSYTDAAVAAEAQARTTSAKAYAPLASPAFTGTPTGPTPAALDSSTKLATTAYADGAVSVEDSRRIASEAKLAPLASPVFSGTPTAPNPSDLPGGGTTKIPNTSWVDNNYLPRSGFITSNTTWTVCSSGCTYSKVEDAWNAAHAASIQTDVVLTLQISDGSYTIASPLYGFVNGKNIHVVGNPTHPANVVLNFPNTSGTSLSGLAVIGGQSIGLVDGLTIQTPTDGTGAIASLGDAGKYNYTWHPKSGGSGIWVNGIRSYINVSDVVISGFYTSVLVENAGNFNADLGSLGGSMGVQVSIAYDGIKVINSSRAVCNYCSVSKVSDASAAAILGSHLSMTNASTSNTAPNVAMFQSQSGSWLGVFYSTISCATGSSGIWSINGSTASISGSTINNCDYGISSDTASSATADATTITNSRLTAIGVFGGSGFHGTGMKIDTAPWALTCNGASMCRWSNVGASIANVSSGSFSIQAAGSGANSMVWGQSSFFYDQ